MKTRNQENFPPPLTWCEVDLKALEHNYVEVANLAARNKFVLSSRKGNDKKLFTSMMDVLAVVKSDAYGHGMNAVALKLQELGVGIIGVSNVQEAVELRMVGVSVPILLFESTFNEHVPLIVEYDLTPTVCTLGFAKCLHAYAKKKNKRINVHVEVDTGMGRLGIWHKDAFDFIKTLYKFDFLNVQGIFTHFPVADTDKSFTRKQIKQLHKLVLNLDREGLIIPYIHAANSMGLAGYKTNVLNLSRPGLMLYGLYPDARYKRKVKLNPVLSVKSKVIFVKDIEKGRGLSYGRTFIAKKKMKVATVPIGYHDGYLRKFSNKAYVLIAGHKCRVLGTVTMDQIMVDVSKLKNVKIGTDVVILGSSAKQSIEADQLAQWAQTINYEIVCNLGNRLPRVTK